MERKRSISIVIGTLVLVAVIYTLSPVVVKNYIGDAIMFPVKHQGR